MNLRMTPLDFDRNGKPQDEKLYAAFQEYCKKQFGAELNCGYYLRSWAVLMFPDGEGANYEVVGVTAIQSIADVCVFHITPPTADKAGLRIAEQARDMAAYRLYSHLEDFGQRGKTVLIYVSEKAQRYWRRFLVKIKAKPANRFEITI